MKNSKLAKIESLDEQMQKMAEQRKQLVLEYKEQESKAKTRRITKRGALIESIQPETLTLTDVQIKALLEMVLLSDFAFNRIKEMQSGAFPPAEPASVKTVPVNEDSDEDDE